MFCFALLCARGNRRFPGAFLSFLLVLVLLFFFFFSFLFSSLPSLAGPVRVFRTRRLFSLMWLSVMWVGGGNTVCAREEMRNATGNVRRATGDRRLNFLVCRMEVCFVKRREKVGPADRPTKAEKRVEGES